ncbi:hypothetical protein POPTR_004G128701v4 [Populus trichocarpa]|uniref:Uncharacterized protein n=1 Tax=Populus trichocarpa TaxID=3694 RepID=A0A2K2ATU1_POPTR|nr:hypothetical protein POPTR_004G128701v4 [Populus trichocarpa]
MVADKGKKSKVTGEEETDHIDGELVLSVEKLQELQDELEKINEQASDEVLGIEQKYNDVRRPVNTKRTDIIKSIPDFWLTAESFLSHPALCDLLTEEDQKIFKYLDSLDMEDSKDVMSGYSITFNFKENAHFEDTKLKKTFTFFEEGTAKITSTYIKRCKWSQSREKGDKRPLAELSFFSWFAETEQEEISELHDEVAEIIKEDLWPNPLKYFNNEADEEDSDGRWRWR